MRKRFSFLLLLGAACSAPLAPAPFPKADAVPSVDVVALLQTLVQIPTVSEHESPTNGPNFATMAQLLRQYALDHGLTFETFGNNDAWIVQLGEGAPALSFVMHGDVVPADDAGRGDAWTHPPFSGALDDGVVWGRGSQDDKGPIAAVLTSLATLKASGRVPSGAVRAVIGTGEEHDWDGMKRFANQGGPHGMVVSMDGAFPVVVGESGFVAWALEIPRGKPSRGVWIDTIEAGAFLTQIPGAASATLRARDTNDLAFVEAVLRGAVALDAGMRIAHPIPCTVESTNDGLSLRVACTGRSAHSSEPEHGANALWALSSVVTAARVRGPGALLLALVATVFDGDHHGARLDIAYEDARMGPLTVAPTLFETTEDTFRLSINMRRPRGVTKESFGERLDSALVRIQSALTSAIVEGKDGRYIGEPHWVDPDGRLPKTLLEIYRSVTGDASSQISSMRGSSYARLFEGAVTFGPGIPGEPYRGHGVNESITTKELEELVQLTTAAIEALLPIKASATPIR